MAEEEKHKKFEGMDGADAFFLMPTERMTRITSLHLTIDGATWTDGEDDAWAIALTAYARHSHRLEHLHLTVKGQVLFTRFNYLKPLLYTSFPFGFLEDVDLPSLAEDAAAAITDTDDTPTKQNRTKDKKLELSPDSDKRVQKYKTRAVPADNVALHITGEKAIIGALSRLPTPIPLVTISGFMELKLRRQIIAALNPEWQDSPHCLLQAGYGDAVARAVEDAERREEQALRTGLHMVKIPTLGREGGGDGDDEVFSGVGFGASRAEWAVGTGGAGRAVYGWRSPNVRAWRGPGTNGWA